MDWLLQKILGQGYQYQVQGLHDLILTQQPKIQSESQTQADQIKDRKIAGQWYLQQPLKGKIIVSCNCQDRKDTYLDYIANVTVPQTAVIVRRLVEGSPPLTSAYVPDRILYSNKLEITGIEKLSESQPNPQTCYFESNRNRFEVTDGSQLEGSIPNIIEGSIPNIIEGSIPNIIEGNINSDKCYLPIWEAW
jgi:hypothetical protein